MRVKGAGAKDVKGTIKRLLHYLAPYKGRLILVSFLILISSVSGAASSLFLGVLIDDFIQPIMQMDHPVFTQLARVLALMAVIYLAGILATLFYNRIMVVVAQGVLLAHGVHHAHLGLAGQGGRRRHLGRGMVFC